MLKESFKYFPEYHNQRAEENFREFFIEIIFEAKGGGLIINEDGDTWQSNEGQGASLLTLNAFEEMISLMKSLNKRKIYIKKSIEQLCEQFLPRERSVEEAILVEFG